jgi:hypothetical protein
VQSGAGEFAVAARQVAAARVEINLPALGNAAPKKPEVQEITVRAQSNGQSIGVVKLRVELRKRALPQ